MKPNLLKIYEKENTVAQKPNAIISSEDSPTRYDIPLHIIEHVEKGKTNRLIHFTIAPTLLSNIINIKRSYRSLKKNTEKQKSNVDDTFVNNLIEFCKKQGVSSIGFTKVSRELVFKEKAVLYENAIVFTKEMDSDRIALAPHRKTAKMVMETYNNLGIIANKVAAYLRSKGFSAQASHPLGGVALYPPLAKEAGLGWFGRHGLLITPEHGPRVRIAVVFTDIPNLPFATENPHSWIPNHCATCGKCIRSCPPKSLMEKPIMQKNGLFTHNISEKCFEYFVENHSCSICIKVCPFSTTGYKELHARYLKKHQN